MTAARDWGSTVPVKSVYKTISPVCGASAETVGRVSYSAGFSIPLITRKRIPPAANRTTAPAINIVFFFITIIFLSIRAVIPRP